MSFYYTQPDLGSWTSPTTQEIAPAMNLFNGWPVGDMVIARLVILDYVARDGESDFDSSRLTVPPGWVVLAWRVIIRTPEVPRYLPIVHVWVGLKSVTQADTKAVAQFSFSSPGALTPAEADLLATKRPFWATTDAERPVAFLLRGHSGVDEITWSERGSALQHTVTTPSGGTVSLYTIEDPDLLTRAEPTKGSNYSVTEEWQLLDSNGNPVFTQASQAAGPYWDAAGNTGTASPRPWSWERFTTPAPSDFPTIQALPRRALISTVQVGAVNRPLRPTILSHASTAYAPAGVPWAFTWRHNPGFAGAQTAYIITRTAGSVTEWWDATAQGWSSSAVTNSSATSSATFPASAWVNGWSGILDVATVGTSSTSPSLTSSVSMTITTLPTPTLFVGAMSQAGTVASMRPAIVIGSTGGGSGVQAIAWEATLTNLDTGQVVASGAGTRLGNWLHGQTFEDGTRLRVATRLQVTGGAWTEWTTLDFTVDVTPPETPTVTVAQVPHPTSGIPGVEVSAAFEPVPGGFPWSTTPVRARVERLDGGVWRSVGTVDPPLGATHLALTDWYAPSGVPVSYRVRAEAVMSDGALLTGGWSQAAGPIALDAKAWLIPYGAPELAVRIREFQREPRAVSSGGTGHDIIGDPYALYATSTQHRRASGGGLRAFDHAELEALTTALLSKRLLLMRRCVARSLRDGTKRQDDDLWMRVVDDVSWDMGWQGPTQWRDVTFRWVPQRAPWGEVEAL